MLTLRDFSGTEYEEAIASQGLHRASAPLNVSLDGYVFSVGIALLLATCGISAFSTLRIWAIWSRALTPTLLMFFASAPALITSFILMLVQDQPIAQHRQCIVRHTLPPAQVRTCQCIASVTFRRKNAEYDFAVVIVNRVTASMSDMTALTLTFMKTAICDVPGLYDAFVFRDSILWVQLIFRTHASKGLTVLRSLFVLNTAASFLRITQTNKMGGIGFCFIIFAFSSNLISRFILDIRSVRSERSDETLTSVRFDTDPLAGSMGAYLGLEGSTTHSWGTGGPDGRYEDIVLRFCADPDASIPGILVSIWLLSRTRARAEPLQSPENLRSGFATNIR
ncbi:hypothetical protein EIP91_006369 [Steccherinum ochraceum]|uniref:Uncharacterized protein n=1 Tax=Steccherinum ochraceum TaxID=92696 RepID=A0A4R0RGL5_9APHY|nr:hypothetical protein EIP91_006369 [Steccherinum ochraceum]